MKTIYKTSGYTFFLSALVMAAPVFAESPEVNFACMKEQVRATFNDFGAIQFDIFV